MAKSKPGKIKSKKKLGRAAPDDGKSDPDGLNPPLEKKVKKRQSKSKPEAVAADNLSPSKDKDNNSKSNEAVEGNIQAKSRTNFGPTSPKKVLRSSPTATDKSSDKSKPKSETSAAKKEAYAARKKKAFGDSSLLSAEGSASAATYQGRWKYKDLWQNCCKEVAADMAELSDLLKHLGLNPADHSKEKNYPLCDYEVAPNIETSKSKDFLDFYIFPILLPGIQAMIEFAKVNNALQCRYCSFNALDYIVEYLYNNNPRYPGRQKQPVRLFDIPFVKDWLTKYPRPALPRCMTMTENEAATIIQKYFVGHMVRIRPDVQEMRQFWKDYNQDLLNEKAAAVLQAEAEVSMNEPNQLMSAYYAEVTGEWDAPPGLDSQPSVYTHSDTCVICVRFREFLRRESRLKHIPNESQLFMSTSSASSENEDEGDGEHRRGVFPPQNTAVTEGDVGTESGLNVPLRTSGTADILPPISPPQVHRKAKPKPT